LIGSNLALATGVMFLAAARLSDNAGGRGAIVFVGLVSVAIACALHLSVLTSRVRLPAAARGLLVTACWIFAAAGTVWIIERAPGPELVIALVTVPPLVGLAGLLAHRTDRWPALAFLGLSLLLSALLAPVWMARSG
jgi:hypothetical protein